MDWSHGLESLIRVMMSPVAFWSGTMEGNFGVENLIPVIKCLGANGGHHKMCNKCINVINYTSNG